MTATVFIDGAAGTTGLEIRDRLSGRVDLAVVTLDEARRKDTTARREALNDADFVILCLPDDAAREAVGLIANPRTRVIDASSAHRVAAGWTYGIPELDPGQSDRIAGADRVANPGCYPTGFLALVRPLVRGKLLPADALISVNATSGYSGGGKAMIAEFEGGTTPTAFQPYALSLGHKHLPEMTIHAGLKNAPIFQPSVANTFRGMVVEVPLHLGQFVSGTVADDIMAVMVEAYADNPIVRVSHEREGSLRIENDAGTDRMTLHVFADAAGRQLRLIATLDNLGKGAGGAAVQNLNIMAGLPATAGLIL